MSTHSGSFRPQEDGPEDVSTVKLAPSHQDTLSDAADPASSVSIAEPAEAESLIDSKSGNQEKNASRSRLPSSGIAGAHLDVWVSVASAAVPLLVFVCLFLYIVVAYQVSPAVPGVSYFNAQEYSTGSPAFFVDFSATKLATIASWASSVATLIPSFVMTLYSYQLANDFLHAQEANPSQLPSPYQLGLLMKSLDGRVTSFYYFISYIFWKSRDGASRMIKSAFTLLAAAMILSYSIWAVDTWLHVTTKTVAISALSTVSQPSEKFGFKLPDGCVGFYDTMYHNVVVKPECYSPYYYCPDSGCGYAYEILAADLSASTQVLSGEQDGKTFSYLVAANISHMDFSTATIAVSASCKPISRQCAMTPESWGFNCSDRFHGYVGGTPEYSEGVRDFGNGCMGMFSDANFTTEMQKSNFSNPVHIGVFAYLPTLGAKDSPLKSDPDMFEYVETVNSFTLGCELSVYDPNYTLINGSISAASLRIADNDTSILAVRSFGWEIADPQFAISTLSSVLGTKTMHEVAQKYAASLERNLIAFAATAFEPRRNFEEHIRRNMLVARVPKAPLFLLVALCIMFAALGIALGLGILCVVGPTRVGDVQARLSVYGLLASRFEAQERAEAPVKKLEDLFEERDGRMRSARVAIVPSAEGGWRYCAVRPRTISPPDA